MRFKRILFVRLTIIQICSISYNSLLSINIKKTAKAFQNLRIHCNMRKKLIRINNKKHGSYRIMNFLDFLNFISFNNNVLFIIGYEIKTSFFNLFKFFQTLISSIINLISYFLYKIQQWRICLKIHINR